MLFNILIVIFLIFCVWGLIYSFRNRNILGILFSGAAVLVFVFSIVQMFIFAAHGEATHPIWWE